MSELVFNRMVMQNIIRTLTYGSLGLMVANVMLAAALVKSNRKPVLLLTRQDNGDVTMVNYASFEMSDVVLTHFVERMASYVLSFSPTSLPEQIENIAVYLSEETRTSIIKSYERNKKAIEAGMYVQFHIQNVEVVERSTPYVIDVQGASVVVNRSGQYKEEMKTYRFQVLKMTPDSDNPYGLKVVRLTMVPDVGQEE